MPFIITGIVLVLIAVGLYFASQGQKKKLGEMKSTETSSSAQLAELAGAVAKDIGAGSFNQVTEVKGVIECADPLVSELSDTACVRYSMSVTREYEETYWEKDDKGEQVQRTRRGSETVASNARSVHFLVRDSSGSIEVDPEGASFVDEKVFSQFRQGENRGERLRFGSYDFNPTGFAALAGGRRTLGYRFEESAIPVGRPVYVLGEAVDRDGRLRVCKPSAKGASFIISLKSEEQLAAGAQSSAKGLFIASIVSCAVGIAVAIFGVFKL
ncbi:MAG: E3 ubiquitin ligase family protein [Treponemataceae bacterium]